MSVYEQIASKARNRRQKKPLNDQTLDEQTEDDDEEEEGDRSVLNHPVNLFPLALLLQPFESFSNRMSIQSIIEILINIRQRLLILPHHLFSPIIVI